MSRKLSVKETILKCAYEIFDEKGYLDCTVKEITEKADVNVAAIKYYFGSKDKLVDIVIDKYLDKLYGLFIILENEYISPEQRLKTYSDNFMTLSASNIFKNLMIQAIKDEKIIQNILKIIKGHANAYRKIIQEIAGIKDENMLNLKIELYISAITYPMLLNDYGIQAVGLDFGQADVREQYIDMLMNDLFH